MKVNLRFIFTGKCKEKYIIEGTDKYLKILRKYGNVEIFEVKSKYSGNVSNAIEKEAADILKLLRKNSVKIFLHLKGKEFSTESFSDYFGKLLFSGNSNFDFIIGGAYGFNENLLKNADLTWKLSKLTFNHQMVRLILLEQVYRILSILNGESYHH